MAPEFENAGAGVRVTIAGMAATALPEGALWIEDARALVVSDLHLEKGSSFAARGQFLPPYDTRATLSRIAELIVRLSPDMVVSLGDSFHDRAAASRLDDDDVRTIRQLTAAREWVWIEGNHDPEPPRDLGGRVARELRIGALTLRHESEEGVGEISGHLHPCATVAGRGGAVRRRCFATDGVRLVMPAFGAFTGGLNVRHEAFSSVFPDGCFALVMGKSRVYPTPPERLAPDARP